jgi:hypothetical protein
MCGRRCHWLGSGKMVTHKGARPWSGTMVLRLRGGLGDSVGSRKIFGRKIWEPDGVSESLRGLEFAKAA